MGNANANAFTYTIVDNFYEGQAGTLIATGEQYPRTAGAPPLLITFHLELILCNIIVHLIPLLHPQI